MVIEKLDFTPFREIEGQALLYCKRDFMANPSTSLIDILIKIHQEFYCDLLSKLQRGTKILKEFLSEF